MTNPVYASPLYRKGRRALLRPGTICAHGCGQLATEADHQPPLSRHRHVESSGCCRLVPSCARCARRQGGQLARRTVASVSASAPARPAPPRPAVEPAGWAPTDAVWDTAPWLAAFRQPPEGATWPRLMTPPHPAAVDSYGREVIEQARKRTGLDLYWWQRLAATRILEHDDAGRLVWDAVMTTVARQCGKSTLLRELALWRIHQGGRFGEPQDVVHTGRDLGICVEVQGPARRWAKSWPDVYKVRESHGSEQIEVLADGSRWLVKATGSPYGWTGSVALVDEAWAVGAQDITEGFLPVMVQKTSPQLLMFSTAHRKATTLVMNRRNAVLGDSADPDQLWLEWSAGPFVEPDDEAGWRAASPVWSAGRHKLISQGLVAARSGTSDDPTEPDPWAAFYTQWLNRWPMSARRAGRGEPLLDEGVWDGCAGALEDTEPGGVVALEENAGEGAAAAMCASSGDGRFELDGVACGSWSEAIAVARTFVQARPGARLLVGARLNNQLPADFPGRGSARKAGSTETGRGLSLLRALCAEGRVVHDDTVQLDEQIARARVHQLTSGGLGLVNNGQRRDLLNASLWALDAAQIPAPSPAVH